MTDDLKMREGDGNTALPAVRKRFVCPGNQSRLLSWGGWSSPFCHTKKVYLSLKQICINYILLSR